MVREGMVEFFRPALLLYSLVLRFTCGFWDSYWYSQL